MKKLFTLLALIGIVSLQSCTVSEVAPINDNDTIPQAFEIKNVNLGRVADNEYNISSTFQFEIGGDLFNDETILVYRMSGLVNSTTPIWQLIPRTIYLSNGNELDYDFDFSKKDFFITARGTYNLLITPQYIDNQTFRIVILPTNLLSSVNKNNYIAVMAALNLKESQVQKINF
ncbi:MAG: hypothetical protein K2Y30_06660 [Flavobacteriaceae bacterium]|uniref:Lipoprotein n=1 Tax=Flavobacterium kayseriense TaxID=2764714 RepID=A0ABR7J6J2_9FLAO|nr:hypothetical protein [Flavobacterium kayseriense]MBC5841155.1 hypothetical protein [Flavobacterium kayseriense]MBC5847683.1 hypothetical protein [Flavobacterium kayseriense]MBU0939893.1 hypothetical protein [Bacteroidota bacterium]MBX9887598.1 hypothetical protein [Flavobacteriaceae bacterium]